MSKRWFLLLAFIACLTSAKGQNPEKLWQDGFLLAGQGKWAQVKELLQPHLFPAPEHPQTPDLFQLYALASWRINDYPSAIGALDKLDTQYPDWKGKAESQYLRGEIFWSKRKWTAAWNHWDALPESYLDRIGALIDASRAPADTLASWNQATGSSASSLRSHWLSQQVQKPVNKVGTVPQIGILLPFSLKDKTTNKPSLDFYRGLSLANEVCTAQDSAMELHVFELGKSDTDLRKLLDKKAFAGLHALVGPLKASAIPALDTWSAQSGTPVFNPLSHIDLPAGSSLTGTEAGFATIARECFSFISKQSTGTKCAIFFGTERNDSLLAAAYRDYAKKMGRQVTAFRKVGKNSAANLTKFLLEANLDSTGHVFVPNNETLVRVQLMSSYGWMKAKFPVLVYGKWLEASNTDYDEFIRNPVFFANPDLPDFQASNWQNWQSSYIAKFGTPPNWVAWKGFDLGIRLSRLWYSDRLREKGNREIPGVVFGPWRFNSLAGDNQFVPIYKMDKEGIQRVWPEGK